MVSFTQTGEASGRMCKRRKRNSGSQSPLRENLSPNGDQSEEMACTPVRRPRTERVRKQNMVSKPSDSGFEEDFITPNPTPSPVRKCQRPVTVKDALAPGSSNRLLFNWYQHYGEIGYQIQKLKEPQFHPVNCLVRQPQVTAESRCKLVSWLIPVHRHLCLSFECCCLAVNIMDRFLASTSVAADCFQLLGVTALLLACKQVEVFSPRISQLLSLCCDVFSREQLCNLECLILLRLNFRLAAPTIAFFLDFYTNHSLADRHMGEDGVSNSSHRLAGDKDEEVKRRKRDSGLALRVCELTLADYAFNKYTPSLTARCALALVNQLLRTSQGPEEPANQLLRINPEGPEEEPMDQSLTAELTYGHASSQENQQGQRCLSENDPAQSENDHSHKSLSDTSNHACIDNDSSLPVVGHLLPVNDSTRSMDDPFPSGNTSALVEGDQTHAPLAQECREGDQTHAPLAQECREGDQTHAPLAQECREGDQTHALYLECLDNLRLLVSLNQDALQAMITL